MKNIPLCSRYAKAYVDLAIEKDELESAVKNSSSVFLYLEQNPQVAQKVFSPLVSREDKIASLAKAVEGKKSIADMVSLVINKGRAEYLMDILSQVQELYDTIKNVCHVSVFTAVALSAEQEKSVEEKMKQATGATTVILHQSVDPSLLGGMKIVVDDRVWDGTVAGRLDEIKKKFQ